MTTDATARRVHLWISGAVQGVFFRVSTRTRAQELGLRGWVRNLADGRVETVAEGEIDVVDRFVDYCRRGPGGARVEDVELVDEEPRGEMDGFHVR